MTIDAVLSGEARYAVVCGKWQEHSEQIPEADILLTDPPYSEHVHNAVRSSRRTALPDTAEKECGTRRQVDLGFAHLDEINDRQRLAHWTANHVTRWSLVFSDTESAWKWQLACEAVKLDYVRTLFWRKLGGAPEFNGTRPAVACEAIVLCHPKGKKRWNGGGKQGFYEHAIVANRLGARASRVHPCQKPLALMLDLVSDFSDPDELIVDPYCGSGTTLVAALRLGRRAIGFEQKSEWAELATEACKAELEQSSLPARRSGQRALFGEST